MASIVERIGAILFEVESIRIPIRRLVLTAVKTSRLSTKELLDLANVSPYAALEYSIVSSGGACRWAMDTCRI
ncbi:MAG: hypothetical protein AAF959_08515 [Cyanobacteria bacterium P01_D01_bin.56]